MLKLNKTLAVFVLFASIAFMGFAIVTSSAGYNFKTKADELDNFVFSRDSATAPWTVKTRVGDEQVGGSVKLLPEAILAALKKQIGDLNQEKQQLDKRIVELEKAIKDSKELIEVDKAAMKARQEVLEKERKRIVAETIEVAAQAAAKSKEVYAQYDLARLRRQEWILMNNQLQEIRTQKDAAIAESQRLRDLLYQSQGDLERAERRQQLLLREGAKLPNEEGVTPPAGS